MFDFLNKKKAEETEEEKVEETVSENEETAEENETINETAAHASITGENYDIEPKTKVADEDVFEGEEGIKIDYSFNGTEIKNALFIFQKETMFKKNIILSLILAAVFAVYMYNISTQEENTLYVFLAVVCVAALAFLWYTPWNHRKNVAKAIDQNPMNFTVTVYETGIRIDEEASCCFMKFGKEINKIAESDESFLFFAGKERLFVLPKRFIEDTEVIRERLKKAMGDKYIVRMKK